MPLKGKRAIPRDSFEMPVKRREAHTRGCREIGDDNGHVMVGCEPVSRHLDLSQPVVTLTDLSESVAHRALQKTIVEFDLVMRCEHINVARH